MSNGLRHLRSGTAALALLTGCHSNAAPPVAPPVYYAAAPTAPAQVSPASVPAYQGGYRLPIEGAWKVHRTHYDMANDQAFAVDLIVHADYPRRRGQNADYPSYGQRVLADAPGVVAVAVDGVPENEPSFMNGYDAHGNYVVIDHRNGEYSLFAHLVPGTVQVRPGQVVAMGQELGRCGNSGHSTMPHLHWQVMDHYQPYLAKARPIRLLAYVKNGAVTGARLEAGDVVRNER